jgi:hypothetical protein
MPIDPSIIGNVMAPQAVQMPDMNAMMRTQTQGMENIYQIEAARKAQAAEAAKAQEDAAVKALLPAYAHALKTGDMRGALKFAPPQYQEGLLPYIEALDGKPLEEIQAALTGSLVTSEVGRAFLENQARTTTAAIQQGQLDVSRARLNFDKSKTGAAPEADYITVPTDQGLYLLNKKTGEYKLMQPGETGIPGPRAVPESGVAAVEAPPAVAGAPQSNVLKPPPKAASAEQTQEERRRAAAVRYAVKNVDKVLKTIDKDPASFGQGADEFALSLVPFGAAEEFKSFVQDANRQQVYYRMNQTVATLLRLATGAAFTSPELVTEAGSYMPKYGDEASTARDKLDALEDRVLSEVGSTGRGFTAEDQAELDALLGAFAAMKDKLYPVGDEGTGGATEDLPEGTTKSNW